MGSGTQFAPVVRHSAGSDSHSAQSESFSAGSESNSTQSPSNSAESQSNSAEFQLTPPQSSAPHPAEHDSYSARSDSPSGESQLYHSRLLSLLSSSITPLIHRKHNRGAQRRREWRGVPFLLPHSRALQTGWISPGSSRPSRRVFAGFLLDFCWQCAGSSLAVCWPFAACYSRRSCRKSGATGFSYSE